MNYSAVVSFISETIWKFFPGPNNKRLSNSEHEKTVSFRFGSVWPFNNEIETTAEIKAQAKAYQSQAARLREENVRFLNHRFRRFWRPEFEERESNQKVASWCEQGKIVFTELDPRDPNSSSLNAIRIINRRMGLALLVNHMGDFYGPPSRDRGNYYDCAQRNSVTIENPNYALSSSGKYR